MSSSCPISRSASKHRDGRPLLVSAFSISPITRSRASPSRSSVRQSAIVSGAIENSSRAANCAARMALSGSRRKVLSSTCRITRFWMSACPPNRSISAPVSASRIIAFIVKSRRLAASSTPIKGSMSASSPFPPPRRGSAMSSAYPRSANTPKLAPISFHGPISPSIFRTASAVIPWISMSTSLLSCPITLSRTKPPTK